MIWVRIIDENGMFVEEQFVSEITDLTIIEPCPSGFFHPKWNGETWIEGLTQSEIEGRIVEPPISAEERIKALETALLELVLGDEY